MSANLEEAEQLRTLESDKICHVTSQMTLCKLLHLLEDQFALLYNGDSTDLINCGELNHLTVSESGSTSFLFLSIFPPFPHIKQEFLHWLDGGF